MIKSYVTGFARIGEERELKFALEDFWLNKISLKKLEEISKKIKTRHYQYQKDAEIDYISCNDFSYYDLMLDHIITFGVIPERFKNLTGIELYFALARGNQEAKALEMTKWFNTNYHYIVPELTSKTKFNLNSDKFINEYKEALKNGIKNPKLNLIGPITFLALSKSIDRSDIFEKIYELCDIYKDLLRQISKLNKEVIIQIEEPIFVTSKGLKYLKYIKPIYKSFSDINNIKIIFTTYFEHSNEAIYELENTNIWAIGVDLVHGNLNKKAKKVIADSNFKLFAGIIDGRNIWISDFKKKLNLIKKLMIDFKDNLIIGTSCSLLHVPISLKYEEELNSKQWLSFGIEKLDEIKILKYLSNFKFCEQKSLNKNLEMFEKLNKNKNAVKSRLNSKIINDQDVQNRIENLEKFQRDGTYEERIKLQKKELNYPDLATTTIGSFPQTPELRQLRNDYKKNLINNKTYEDNIKLYIKKCIKFQEEIGLDILVHGEPERNDMVEYFAQYLKGYIFSQNGWVQSYGSRCVKPPILFGDISRKKPMTIKWIKYAQNQSKKIVKGMLTGPMTILNWSFVRDDKTKADIATQLALCIYDEIKDLQKNNIKIIQVDEAAFKEGYPLRNKKVKYYENFALNAFKLAVSGAKKTTQIHTHMCYSDFNDIIKTIEKMDADVILIETARSGNELLEIFKSNNYKKNIGPGVYDIHSPRIPDTEELVKQIDKILEILPKNQIWINPDCGLKTRKWKEVELSLKNMIKATNIIKDRYKN